VGAASIFPDNKNYDDYDSDYYDNRRELADNEELIGVYGVTDY